jgi:hypothetical protein
MSKWYRKVSGNMAEIVNAISHYEIQIAEAKFECGMKGSLEKHSRDMPGIVEHRFNQLQETEAILEYLNTEMRKLRSQKYRLFTEHWQRKLTPTDAKAYIDGEAEVVDLQHLIVEFSQVRNKFMGIIKALEVKQWQLTNVIRLRVAGLEDARI